MMFRWLGLLWAALLLIAPTQVVAQTTFSYTQTTDIAINNGTTCIAPAVRTFTVIDSFNVADVDIGIYVQHTWRGDLQFTLQAPNGTRVQLNNGNTAAADGDNFNVLFDDSASQQVGSDDPNGNHSTTAPPPFQNTFSPVNPLTAFSGVASAGTWRLEICDLYPQADNGNFRHAVLYLRSPPPNFADLSLTKSLVGSAPADGGSVTWRLTVANSAASTQSATGVTIRDYLPIGFNFTSASGGGSFNSATGIWTVGTLGVGQSSSIDITGTITASAGATITNTAEVTASSALDSDSTVNNGINGEDDSASLSFVVAGSRVPGIAPTLSCPAGSILFDWDPQTWAAGSTNNSYALGTLGSIQFQLANPGVWLNNAGLGGQSPNLQTDVNAGFTGQRLLIELVNMPSISSEVTSTITLPMVMQGAQFRVADVDFGAGQFADLLRVEGRYKGSTVFPTLTNGAANYVVGNTAYGDGASDNTSTNGNVAVTFNSPIDQIIVYYGNHSMAPADPGQQAIALHDITFCRPTTTIATAKSSLVVSDPFNNATNPKMIPGSVVEYCIQITNTGDNAATSIAANDPLPTRTTYVPGSMTSGATCAAATTVEDDNNTGADESDPYGASVSGTVINATAASLAAGGSFALKFRTVVN